MLNIYGMSDNGCNTVRKLNQIEKAGRLNQIEQSFIILRFL